MPKYTPSQSGFGHRSFLVLPPGGLARKDLWPLSPLVLWPPPGLTLGLSLLTPTGVSKERPSASKPCGGHGPGRGLPAQLLYKRCAGKTSPFGKRLDTKSWRRFGSEGLPVGSKILDPKRGWHRHTQDKRGAST